MTSRHFPHPLYLVHHLPTNSYGCAYADSVRGLACFADARRAHRFARHMETRHNLIIEMAMADACEVAAQSDLTALVLADDEAAPVVHRLREEPSRS